MVRNLLALLVCLHITAVSALALALQESPADKPLEQSPPTAEKPEAAGTQPSSKADGQADKPQGEQKKEGQEKKKEEPERGQTVLGGPIE